MRSYFESITARQVKRRARDECTFYKVKECSGPFGNMVVLDPESKKYANMAFPLDSFYPYFNHQLDNIYEAIRASKSPVVFLYGAPGVAKTTFINGYIKHCNSKKILEITRDEDLIKHDAFDVAVKQKIDLITVEDCDAILVRRQDGNRHMARFLNQLDGSKGKLAAKVFITTNIKNIEEIDPALTRPGRCFASMYFSSLNREQAAKVCEDMNLPTDGLKTKDHWTIAELVNIDTLSYSVAAGGKTYGKIV